MPLYTYRCVTEGCGHVEDKIVKMADRDQPHTCDKCKNKDSMLYEAYTSGDTGSNLYFRGNWFATTRKY